MTSLFTSSQNNSDSPLVTNKDDLRISLFRWYLILAGLMILASFIFVASIQRQLGSEIEEAHMALAQGMARHLAEDAEAEQLKAIFRDSLRIGGINNHTIVIQVNEDRKISWQYEFFTESAAEPGGNQVGQPQSWHWEITRQLSGTDFAAFETVGPVGREWEHYAVRLADGGWLIVQRPYQYAYATTILINRVFFIALSIFFIGTLASWLILSKQIINPLGQLETFSEIIRWRGHSRPDETQVINKLITKRDQIGNLARGLVAMEQDVNNRFVQLSTLLETSRVVAGSLDAAKVIDNILNQVEAMFDVPRSAVVVLDKRAGVFRIRASRGLSAEYAQTLRIAPSEPNSPSMRALRNMAPVQVADTESDFAFSTFRARAQQEGFRSLLAIPLQTQHAPPAVLLLFKSEPYRYSYSELELASSFGNHASVALENAALFARTDEQLQEQTRRLEAIVESLDDGLVLESLDGKVLYCNQQTCRWLHLSRSQLQQKSAAELIGHLLGSVEEPELAAQHFELARGGSGSQSFDLEQALPNGRCRYLRINLFDVTDSQGELLGHGQLWQDITKDKEVDTMKSALLSTVSHELRTPLAAIKGYASTLLADDVEWGRGAQQEFLTTISEETDRLTALVQNLLDMSRIEAGILEVRGEYYSLSDLCREVIEGFHPPFNGRLQTDFKENLPFVWMDLSRIGTVIRNYIENALKYAPEDSKIELSTFQTKSNIVLAVRDYGPGIPPELHQKVFDRFYRADSSLTQRVGGTGLGLAICKGLIEAHDGQVWIETADPGVVFYFSLPLEPEKTLAG